MSVDPKRADVLVRIEAKATEISEANALLERLYEERMGIWREGLALDPPLLQREIAEASGIKEIAVTVALRKDRLRSEAVASQR